MYFEDCLVIYLTGNNMFYIEFLWKQYYILFMIIL